MLAAKLAKEASIPTEEKVKKELTVSDIRNNYTPANLAKLKKGFFCLHGDVDYEVATKKARTNKLFGL